MDQKTIYFLQLEVVLHQFINGTKAHLAQGNTTCKLFTSIKRKIYYL
jgi:hypothetical protein